MRKLTLISLLFCASLLAISCGGKDNPANSLQTSNSQTTTQNQLIIGIVGEPDSLHPLFAQTMTASEIQGLLFEPMVEYDDQGILHPRLVESIPTIENGGIVKLPNNKIQTTWVLKEGLKWSDGHPLTTEDFIFTYKVIMDERVPVASRDLENRIEKMEAQDLRTLVVTWKETYAYSFFGHTLLPKHILKKAYRKNLESLSENTYGENPIGNGPYKLETWEKGQYMSFIRNEHFNGKTSSIERIVYKILPGSESFEAELLDGDIHALSPASLVLNDLLDFEKRYAHIFNFVYTNTMIWEHVSINLDDPVLQDKRVRQALMYGLDREKMLQEIFNGKQSVADSWVPSTHYGYNPSVKKYSYDVARAEQLLDEAGWLMKEDGYRYKDGAILEFSIMTTEGNTMRESVEAHIQSDWKKIGAKLEIQNQPTNIFFGDTTSHRKFPHFALYAWVMSPISDGESFWTSKNIPREDNDWQGENHSGWRHEEIDILDSQVPVTLEESERKKLLKKEQEMWTEELPVFPLFWRVEPSIARKEVENWKPTGTSTPVTWNAEEWGIAEDVSSFSKKAFNSFTELPSNVVEDFEARVFGKSFEEIYNYAGLQGIDVIVTQVEDEEAYDKMQYFNISDYYVEKTGAATDYFIKKNEACAEDDRCDAFFRGFPLEGITTKPAVYLKRKPLVGTFYHEMIHALEYLYFAPHFKSEFFSKYVDVEELESLREVLCVEKDELWKQYEVSEDGINKDQVFKKYLTKKLDFYMAEFFISYLRDRQHLYLAKYLFSRSLDVYDYYHNLVLIEGYIKNLKSPEHNVNNGKYTGEDGIQDVIFSTFNSYEVFATDEEKIEIEKVRIKVQQDIEAVKIEACNVIGYFESWLAARGWE